MIALDNYLVTLSNMVIKLGLVLREDGWPAADTREAAVAFHLGRFVFHAARIRGGSMSKLRPMSEAPKDGPVFDILVATTDRHNHKHWLIVHYAYGGGEEQPPFRGWFYRIGDGYSQADERKFLGWLPLPELETP